MTRTQICTVLFPVSCSLKDPLYLFVLSVDLQDIWNKPKLRNDIQIKDCEDVVQEEFHFVLSCHLKSQIHFKFKES